MSGKSKPLSAELQITMSAEEALGKLNQQEHHYAPAALYLAGDCDLLRHGPRVSIVGSRKASPEGLLRAARLTRILVERGVTIVSGLAEGIDHAAHTTAIAAGGRTIAVVGTPLDQVYPAKHRELQDEIAHRHLVLSQFSQGSRVFRSNFPARNRTMALIVDASVIVEAGDGSGTLSQGWEALRLNRPLFIMKSVVDNPELKWPTDMLEYGARVLMDPADLLDRLPYGEPLASLPA